MGSSSYERAVAHGGGVFLVTFRHRQYFRATLDNNVLTHVIFHKVMKQLTTSSSKTFSNTFVLTILLPNFSVVLSTPYKLHYYA